ESALQLAIDNYAAGHTDAAHRYLTAAWRAVLPDVRATIRGRIVEPELREDAEQEAFIKLWQAVRNWKPGRSLDSEAAMARWFASKAALNVVERRDRSGAHENPALDDDEKRDAAEYRAGELKGADGLVTD